MADPFGYIPNERYGDLAWFRQPAWDILHPPTTASVLTHTGVARTGPVWGLPGDLSIAGQATGDLLYFNGTNWVRKAIGTAAQALVTAGGVPAWATLDPGYFNNPYKFRAYRSAASGVQAVGSGAFTVIQFASESFDSNNNFDSTTNYNYTVPKAGFYQLNAWTDGSTNVDGAGIAYILSVFKNGAEIVRSGRFDTEVAALTVGFGLTVSSLEQLAVNDTVDIRIFQNSGGNRNINISGTGFSCVFSGYMVSTT